MSPERYAELIEACAHGATLSERIEADRQLTLDLVARLEASDYRCPGHDPFIEIRGGLRRARIHASFGRLCSPFAFDGGFIALVHSPRRPLKYPPIAMPEEE